MAGLALGHKLRQAADVSGDHGHATSHGLQGSQSEALLLARKQEEVEFRQELRGILLGAKEFDPVEQAQLVRHQLHRRQVGTVADHQQASWNVLHHAVKRPDDVRDALDPPKVRQVPHQGLVSAGEARPRTAIAMGGREPLQIDEIVDCRDFALQVEAIFHLPGKVVRHGRDSVAFEQAEACDLVEGIVEPDQGDVRAVQRGHDLRSVAAQHLAAEIRADGVRDRIVGVKHVDRLFATQRCQLRGQGQRVGRIREQRVPRDRHFVEADPRMRRRDPDRAPVADDMDRVAPLGQRHAKIRGHDPAAAQGRVADDGYRQRSFHGSLLNRPTRSLTGIGTSLLNGSP